MSQRLEARDLSLRAGRRVVITGLSFAAGPGERIAVIGPNGAGKSTFLRTLAGLQPPAAGSVLLDGEHVERIPPARRARRIATLTQHPDVPFPYSALETALLGRAPHLGHFGLPARADIDRAMDLLRELEVDHRAHAPIQHLSGGERQRVHLARILLQDTDVLLLDEPTSDQDFRGTALMLQALGRRAAEGATVLIALHDLNLAPRFLDRALLLADGALLADDKPATLLASDAIRCAWGDGVELTTLADGTPVVLPRRSIG